MRAGRGSLGRLQRELCLSLPARCRPQSLAGGRGTPVSASVASSASPVCVCVTSSPAPRGTARRGLPCRSRGPTPSPRLSRVPPGPALAGDQKHPHYEKQGLFRVVPPRGPDKLFALQRLKPLKPVPRPPPHRSTERSDSNQIWPAWGWGGGREEKFLLFPGVCDRDKRRKRQATSQPCWGAQVSLLEAPPPHPRAFPRAPVRR